MQGRDPFKLVVACAPLDAFTKENRQSDVRSFIWHSLIKDKLFNQKLEKEDLSVKPLQSEATHAMESDADEADAMILLGDLNHRIIKDAVKGFSVIDMLVDHVMGSNSPPSQF